MIAKRILKNSTFQSKHLVIGMLTFRIGGFGKINFPNERVSPTCTYVFSIFFTSRETILPSIKILFIISFENLLIL